MNTRKFCRILSSNYRATVRDGGEFNQLLTYEDNDLCLFKTPPSSYYWAFHPRFQDDEYVASPSDFLHGDDFCRDDDYLEAFGEKTHSLDIE